MLELVPPAIDLDLVTPGPNGEDRDYGPDPVAEFALTIPAKKIFDVQALNAAMTESLGNRPGFISYVTTPDGRTTHMVSSDAPSEAVTLIPA